MLGCVGHLCVAPYTEIYQAWAKTVNASGGINGHPVQLIVRDDGSSPATSFERRPDSDCGQSCRHRGRQCTRAVLGHDGQGGQHPCGWLRPIVLDFGTNSDFYSPSGTADTTIPAISPQPRRPELPTLAPFTVPRRHSAPSSSRLSGLLLRQLAWGCHRVLGRGGVSKLHGTMRRPRSKPISPGWPCSKIIRRW